MRLKEQWKHLSTSHYESGNGLRIYVGGLLIVKGNERIQVFTRIALRVKFARCRAIQGGNYKRALMLLAESL